MANGRSIIKAILSIALILCAIVNFGNAPYYNISLPLNKPQQKNHPPKVKIVIPKNNSSYEWNTRVRYKINVSDKEDGESKYREISPQEVFLEIKYLPDFSKDSTEFIHNIRSDSELTLMRTTNCWNCHGFKTKLIGPSFYEISKHYGHTKSNIELLAKRIKDGSSGIWGNAGMPTHPKLTIKETQDIVAWIFNNVEKANLDYDIGLEGSFRIKKLQTASSQEGIFRLTASYIDHGLKDNPGQNLRGHDMIIIHGK